MNEDNLKLAQQEVENALKAVENLEQSSVPRNTSFQFHVTHLFSSFCVTRF